MYKKNCVTGALLALLFAFFLVQTINLNEQAALWPRAVCILGILLSLGSVASSAWQIHKQVQDEKEPLLPLTMPQLKRGAILLLLLILWAIGIRTLGFLVSSIIIMSAVFVTFEPQRNAKRCILDVVLAVIVGVLLYFLFSQLGVHFPSGLLM